MLTYFNGMEVNGKRLKVEPAHEKLPVRIPACERILPRTPARDMIPARGKIPLRVEADTTRRNQEASNILNRTNGVSNGAHVCGHFDDPCSAAGHKIEWDEVSRDRTAGSCDKNAGASDRGDRDERLHQRCELVQVGHDLPPLIATSQSESLPAPCPAACNKIEWNSLSPAIKESHDLTVGSCDRVVGASDHSDRDERVERRFKMLQLELGLSDDSSDDDSLLDFEWDDSLLDDELRTSFAAPIAPGISVAPDSTSPPLSSCSNTYLTTPPTIPPLTSATHPPPLTSVTPTPPSPSRLTSHLSLLHNQSHSLTSSDSFQVSSLSSTSSCTSFLMPRPLSESPLHPLSDDEMSLPPLTIATDLEVPLPPLVMPETPLPPLSPASRCEESGSCLVPATVSRVRSLF